MASRGEHLELNDLLYTKAYQLNQSEDVVSNILSAECVLVSFDHLVDAFLCDWNYRLYNSDAGREIRTQEFQNFVIAKLQDNDAKTVIKSMDKAFILRNKILYLRRTTLKSVKLVAQKEIKQLIEEVENARHLIKAGIFR